MPDKSNKWSLELLHSLDWKLFENLSAMLFEAKGFIAKTQTHGSDGGIDIHLYFGSGNIQLVNIVQVKAWKTQKVGVKEVREFFGTITAENAPRGTFIGLSGFTNDAVEFTKKQNKIFLMNGQGFLDLLLELEPKTSRLLLEKITIGDYTTPTCASCGIKLVKRVSSKDKREFWGCKNYPRCRSSIAIGHQTKSL